MLVQFVFTLGCALILSALTVHFRDIRDILSNVLTLWFFATPIIYPYLYAPEIAQAVPQLEPVHAPHHLLSGDPVLRRAVRPLEVARGAGRVLDLLFLFGYFIFDRLRDSFAEEV